MFMYQYAFGNIHIKKKYRFQDRRGKARAGKIPARKSTAGKNPSAVEALYKYQILQEYPKENV